MIIPCEIGLTVDEKVMRLRRLRRELLKAINDAQGPRRFDLDYLLFDVMNAVGLLSLDNLSKVIGTRKAKKLWEDLQ